MSSVLNHSHIGGTLGSTPRRANLQSRYTHVSEKIAGHRQVPAFSDDPTGPSRSQAAPRAPGQDRDPRLVAPCRPPGQGPAGCCL